SPVDDERGGPPLVDGHRGQPARASLDQDLPEGVGPAAEEEEVGACVRLGEIVALEPAEEGRAVAEALAQHLFLRPASAEQQVEPRIGVVGADEGFGQQLYALLLGLPPYIQDLDRAGVGISVTERRVEARGVDAAAPTADRTGLD